MSNYIELTWAETGRKRWVNKNHIVWFAESPEGLDEETKSSVYVTGDDVAGVQWLGCRETPEEIIKAINQ